VLVKVPTRICTAAAAAATAAAAAAMTASTTQTTNTLSLDNMPLIDLHVAA
jgi:hypothetical protein